jgi:AcrR family transcriptional regulator
VDRIVAAAVAVADRDGLPAVTMRRVARELAVAPMSLYTYVPGKAELVDLMLDSAFGAMRRTEPGEDHWRARLTAIADDNRALHEAHPWVAAATVSRPPLGPGVTAKYEYELRALDGLGLDDVEMDAALTFLLGFVATCARSSADQRAAQQDSALSDRQWWEANEPLLSRIFDATKYPTAVRVGAAAGAAHQAAYCPAHAYRFGLDRVLDGLGALIESRSGRARRSRR